MEQDAPEEDFDREYGWKNSMLRDSLERVVRGEDIGRNVSEVFYRADLFGHHQLRKDHAETLRYLAVRGAIKACEDFPTWAPRTHIRRGFAAFYRWLEWAQVDPEHRKGLWDLDGSQRMRVLRNLGHNVSLEADIEDRIAAQWRDIAAGIERVVRK